MKVQEKVLLKPYTNYKIGGYASYFVDAKTEQDVLQAFEWARENNQPVFVLGSGTNIIVSDNGYQGLVLRNNVNSYSVEGQRITAFAGVEFQTIVDKASEQGLLGLEWAGGLPGSVGGAVHGNVGAFGGEIKDVLVSVRARTPEGEVKEMFAAECEMAYRESIFKKQNGWVVISAVFELQGGHSPEELKAKVEELREWRRTKHPIEYGNCGSVFKRIPVTDLDEKLFTQHPDMSRAIREEKIAIAYFIDQCGLKKRRIGGVEVSDKHPNFLVNITGDARAEDVVILVGVVKHRVLEQFGVFLEEEIEYIGFD